MDNHEPHPIPSVLALTVVILAGPVAHAQCDAADLFGPSQNFATGNSPLSVAIGDLDGDGVADLVITNGNSNTVSVLLGNGDGTFQPRQDFAVGNGPWSVAIGDLDGDGVPDLAVANTGSGSNPGNTVSVLLGNGDGTFQPSQNFLTESRPVSVAIADLNGDGLLDLAAANFDSATVSVLLGNGDGTYQPRQDFVTGSNPYSVAIGDLNGDSVPDLAVASGAGVSVLLGNGDGSFQPHQNYFTGSSAESVAIGDLNGDGVPDLAVANHDSNTVSALLGNGDGSFQPRQDFTTKIQPRSVAIADLNGDGLPELAVTGGASTIGAGVSVLLGDGDGTFQPRHDFPTGRTPRFVATADLNGDGMPDLAVVNRDSNTVTVLLNQCVPVIPCTPDLDGNGLLNFFDIAAFLLYYQTQNPTADWNNDGQLNFFDFAAYLIDFNAGCP